MDILILCDDALNLILKQSENCYCTIVCKKWYDLIIKSSNICSTCNKLIKIYDMKLWIDENNFVCHTEPLFIKPGSTIMNYTTTVYGKCFSDTIYALKDLSEYIYILIGLTQLVIQTENSNKTISANLTLEKQLTRQEHIYSLNNNESILVKLNANDFYKSIENSPMISLNLYNGTKLYFENNNNKDNYLKVITSYSKIKLFKSLKVSDDEMQKFNISDGHNIRKFFEIPQNYKRNINLNNNDFEILRTLPQCISDAAIFTNNNGHVITISTVTNLGNLKLKIDS